MGFSTRPAGRGHRPHAMAEINVTPLVDVMLVLLIVFMITAPMLAAGLRVDLPQARSAAPLSPREPVIVTVAREGGVRVGVDDVPLERLVDEVRRRLAGEDRVVHLRGDRGASYGEVVAAIDRLAAGGVVRIALMANAREPATSATPVDPASPGATR